MSEIRVPYFRCRNPECHADMLVRERHGTSRGGLYWIVWCPECGAWFEATKTARGDTKFEKRAYLKDSPPTKRMKIKKVRALGKTEYPIVEDIICLGRRIAKRVRRPRHGRMGHKSHGSRSQEIVA